MTDEQYDEKIQVLDNEFARLYREINEVVQRMATVPGKHWLNLSTNATLFISMFNAMKLAFAEKREAELYAALEVFFKDSKTVGWTVLGDNETMIEHRERQETGEEDGDWPTVIGDKTDG